MIELTFNQRNMRDAFFLVLAITIFSYFTYYFGPITNFFEEFMFMLVFSSVLILLYMFVKRSIKDKVNFGFFTTVISSLFLIPFLVRLSCITSGACFVEIWNEYVADTDIIFLGIGTFFICVYLFLQLNKKIFSNYKQ